MSKTPVGGPSVSVQPSGSSGASRLFQAEPEESETVFEKKPVRQGQLVGSVFGPEREEGNSQISSSDGELGSEQDYIPQKDTVFSLGWHSLSSYDASSFWKEHMDDPKSARKKRKYDNTKRSDLAIYARQQSYGTFKKMELTRLDCKSYFNRVVVCAP